MQREYKNYYYQVYSIDGYKEDGKLRLIRRCEYDTRAEAEDYVEYMKRRREISREDQLRGKWYGCNTGFVIQKICVEEVVTVTEQPIGKAIEYYL